MSTLLKKQTKFKGVSESNGVTIGLDLGTLVYCMCDSEMLLFQSWKLYPDLESVKRLIRKTENVNARDMNGNTLLHGFCNSGNVEAVELLLQHGAMINVENRIGQTPLWIACREDHENIVGLLLEEPNVDVNVCGEYQDSPLIMACRSDNRRIVQMLIDRGANLNYIATGDSFSALHFETDCCEKSFACLLENNIDVNIGQDRGWTAIMNSMSVTHVKKLLREYPNLHVVDEDGETALSLASCPEMAAAIQMAMDRKPVVSLNHKFRLF